MNGASFARASRRRPGPQRVLPGAWRAGADLPPDCRPAMLLL